MNEPNNRRSFIKKLSVGGLTATSAPEVFAQPPARPPASEPTRPPQKATTSEPSPQQCNYNATYRNEHLTRLAFPIGGLGASMFGQRRTGNGASGTIFGLPRFHSAEFTARFPFGPVDLSDEDIPLEVQAVGWSPFVPTDEDNSSLPVGALEYPFTNRRGKE